MSIPPSVPVKKVLDRLSEVSRGLSDTDLAARWGVTRGYVTQIRTGYRPERMGATRRARLVALVEELEAGYDSGRLAAGGRAEFYDGVLFAAQSMSETVTRLLAEARAGLKRDEAPLVTPTAGEIADGLAGLEIAEREKAAAKPGKGRVRRA